MTPRLASWGVLIALSLVLAGVGLRIVAASQVGLWADEIFSLAMATGHSLEHPAAVADTDLGDFAEPREPAPPAAFRRYAEQETPAAGPRRVIRAVLLSDTSPPLYYLLLNPWTRLFGTGDAALRLFSTFWAVASLPLLWLVGRQVGDVRTAWTAVVLFALSPIALFYSAEGRMYALLWFTGLALVWSTLRWDRAGGDARAGVVWIAAGVAGLLTHYFFAFVWLACMTWLLLRARGGRMGAVVLLAGLTMLAVLPWYLGVPASLARWRVTEGWLDGSLPWPGALARPADLAMEQLAGRSYLGGWEQARLVVQATGVILAVALLAMGRLRSLFDGERSLLWACVAAACCGPLVFDVLRHTTTTTVPRYALTALPPLLLLLATALARTPKWLHVTMLGAITLSWLPGLLGTAFSDRSRPWQPYPGIAGALESRLDTGDVVILSSIPSGVVGIARYLDEGIPIVSWVAPLGTREARDTERLVAGRRRVALAEVTSLGASSPAREWLEVHGRQIAEDTFRSSSSKIVYFVPMSGDVFGTGTPD
jgi:mannosyltransferase